MLIFVLKGKIVIDNFYKRVVIKKLNKIYVSFF